MPTTSPSLQLRFQRHLFHGRCRRNLLIGLALVALAAAYAIWGGQRFSTRGADAKAFDQVIVQFGGRIVGQPMHLRGLTPQNDRELYLLTVISDQRDVMVGLTILILRMILALSAGGLGMVLLTAGATEWEIRSRLLPAPEASARSGV